MNNPDPLDKDEEAKIFRAGLDLFNGGEWFEAHEAWEDAWHNVSGTKKKFYQGLIQCAVVVEHVRRGNPRGVRSVWETAQTKFVGLADVYMGVNIRRLLADVENVIRPVLELPAASFNPALPRSQDLPVNWDDAPRIELE